MKAHTIPPHSLIASHPVDTLSHVQAILRFAQEYTAKTTEDAELTPYEISVNAGLHAILKVVNDALEYEINRLDHHHPLTVVE